MTKWRTPYERGRYDYEQGRPKVAPTFIRDISGMVDWHKGYDEAKARHDREQAAFQAEEDRWRYLPASYRKLHELGELIGTEAATKVQELVQALIDEAKPAYEGN